MIYFVQSGVSGPVKIGYTEKDPAQRIRELQTGNPQEITLLGTIEGDLAAEMWLHRRYESQKIRGEWFAYCEDMAAMILHPCIPEITEDPKPDCISKPKNSIQKIVDLAGGNSIVAQEIGISRHAVYFWKDAGIPQRHWGRIMEMTDGVVTVEHLFKANQTARENAA